MHFKVAALNRRSVLLNICDLIDFSEKDLYNLKYHYHRKSVLLMVVFTLRNDREDFFG